MPRSCSASSRAADIPAGTSTELSRNGSGGEHVGRRRGRRQQRRAGVGRGERIGAEGDHPGHAELAGQFADRRGEPVPRHVRLRTAEQQHVVALRIAADLDLGGQPHESGVDAVAQLEQGTAGPVVDEHVAVERDQRRRPALRLERIHRRGGGATGVDPAGQHDDEHRLVKVGGLGDEPVVSHRVRAVPGARPLS